METVAATASAFLLPICLLKNSLISGSSLSLLVSLLGSFDLAYVQRTQSGAWNHNSTKWRATLCMDKKRVLPDLLTRKSMMPLAGDERRLRDSGEREDRRRLDGSVVRTRWPPPRLLTDKSTGSIWIGGHSACFYTQKRKSEWNHFCYDLRSFPGKVLSWLVYKTQRINKYNKIKQVKKLTHIDTINMNLFFIRVSSLPCQRVTRELRRQVSKQNCLDRSRLHNVKKKNRKKAILEFASYLDAYVKRPAPGRSRER